MRIALVAGLLCLVALAGCSSGEELSEDPGELRGDWVVRTVDDLNAESLGVIVSFDDGWLRTENVCNPFTVPYGYAESFIQHLALTTTVTYAGVGCSESENADEVDNAMLGLLYFNTEPISYETRNGELTLLSSRQTATLARDQRP